MCVHVDRRKETWNNFTIDKSFCFVMLHRNHVVRFRIDVGRFTLVGPVKDQSFTCVSGHRCSLDTVQVWYPDLRDQLLVMDTCGTERDMSLTSFSGRQMISETVTSHPNFQPGLASFSSQVIAPGGTYRLCWSRRAPVNVSDSLSDDRDQRNFLVDVGRLYLIGPRPLQQNRTCVSGQTCALKVLTGIAPSVNWKIMVLDTCGQHASHSSNVASRSRHSGFPNSGLAYTYPSYFTEVNFTESPSGAPNVTVSAFSAIRWGDRGDVLTAPGGLYRLCWCASLSTESVTSLSLNGSVDSNRSNQLSPLTNPSECSDASRFLLDIGSLSIMGPLGTSRTCISGRPCMIGRFPPDEQGYVLVLDTCGKSNAIVRGFVAEISSSTEISAPEGQYRMCWCRSEGENKNRTDLLFTSLSTFRCEKTEDFLVDMGGLYLLGPWEGSLARTCISGMSCSFNLDDFGLRHELNATSSVFILDTCGHAGGPGVSRMSLSISTLTWSMTGFGGKYRLCWCFLDSKSLCNVPQEHSVDAGALLFLGPTPQSQSQTNWTCVAGQQCRVSGLSHPSLPSEMFFILATCGFSSFLPKRIAERDGDFSGVSGPVSLNASNGLDFGIFLVGGTYRLCWCFQDCLASMDFQTDIGELSVIGPSGSQDRTCIAGMTCSIHTFDGFGLGHVWDHVMILSTCGVALDAVSGVVRAVSAKYPVVTDILSAGEYRLCWCGSLSPFQPSPLNTSYEKNQSVYNEFQFPSCVLASDFLVDVGRLLLQDGHFDFDDR